MFKLIKVYLIVLITTQLVNCDSSDVHKSRKLYKLMSGGLGQIFWDEILFNDNQQLTIKLSNSCKSSLDLLKTSFKEQKLDVFRFIDSSAKASSALLDGSFASLGDYDECLEIKIFNENIHEKYPNIFGKYCMVSFTYDTKYSNTTELRDRLMKTIPVADHYHPLSGLCIPSTCSKKDLTNLIESILPSFDLKLINVTHCDTNESISFNYSKMALIQKMSFIFAASSLFFVFLGTISSIIGINFLKTHSLIDNYNKLISTEGRDSRIGVADIFKTVFALYATAVHSIAAITSPAGTYILRRIVNLDDFVITIWIQPFINVAGLNIISFLGGLTLGWSIYPLIKSGKTSFVSLIKDRWMRLVPGILALIAFDVLWPLIGSGPMYQDVGRNIVDTCSKTWYLNLLMVNNYLHILDICSNHTFWTAIDFQLFLIGLILIYILLKSRRIGLIICLIVAIADPLITGYYSVKFNTPHALAAYPMNVTQVLNYLDNIHDPVWNYMLTYVTGLIVGIYLSSGRVLNVGRYGIIASFIFCEIASYYTAFFNAIHVNIEWKPYFMSIGKICWAASCSLAIFYFTFDKKKMIKTNDIIDKKFIKKHSKDVINIDENNNVETPIKQKMSRQTSRDASTTNVSFGYKFGLLVSRLSTSLYLVNYWFIRYDFFTTRQPFDVNPLSFFKRFWYTATFALITAFFFHLFLLAPLDNLRKKYVPTSIKIVDKSNEKDKTE